MTSPTAIELALQQILDSLSSMDDRLLYLIKKFEVQGVALLDPAGTESLRESVSLSADAPILGLNWYRPEKLADRVWRWSGPGNLSTIYVPVRREISCTLELGPIRYHKGVQGIIRLFVDGNACPFDIKEDSFLRAIIPPKQRGGVVTELSFLTDTTMLAGDDDSRWIGFSFERLSMAPTASDDPSFED